MKCRLLHWRSPCLLSLSIIWGIYLGFPPQSLLAFFLLIRPQGETRQACFVIGSTVESEGMCPSCRSYCGLTIALVPGHPRALCLVTKVGCFILWYSTFAQWTASFHILSILLSATLWVPNLGPWDVWAYLQHPWGPGSLSGLLSMPSDLWVQKHLWIYNPKTLANKWYMSFPSSQMLPFLLPIRGISTGPSNSHFEANSDHPSSHV